MGIGHAMGAHFVQDHGHIGTGQLPGRFRSGQAATNYMYRFSHALGSTVVWTRLQVMTISPRSDG
jgi:hypothetical protein